MAPHLGQSSSAHYIKNMLLALLAVTIFGLLLMSLAGFMVEPNVSRQLSLTLPASKNTSLKSLQEDWPKAEHQLTLKQPTWRSVSIDSQLANNNSEPVASNNLEQAKQALAERQFAQVVSLLSSDNGRAALLLKTAALQQLGEHQQVVNQLQSQALSAELHLRLAISYEALSQYSSARFHYQAFLSATDTPSSLQQYARNRLILLGGSS